MLVLTEINQPVCNAINGPCNEYVLIDGSMQEHFTGDSTSITDTVRTHQTALLTCMVDSTVFWMAWGICSKTSAMFSWLALTDCIISDIRVVRGIWKLIIRSGEYRKYMKLFDSSWIPSQVIYNLWRTFLLDKIQTKKHNTMLQCSVAQHKTKHFIQTHNMVHASKKGQAKNNRCKLCCWLLVGCLLPPSPVSAFKFWTRAPTTSLITDTAGGTESQLEDPLMVNSRSPRILCSLPDTVNTWNKNTSPKIKDGLINKD